MGASSATSRRSPGCHSLLIPPSSFLPAVHTSLLALPHPPTSSHLISSHLALLLLIAYCLPTICLLLPAICHQPSCTTFVLAANLPSPMPHLTIMSYPSSCHQHPHFHSCLALINVPLSLHPLLFIFCPFPSFVCCPPSLFFSFTKSLCLSCCV